MFKDFSLDFNGEFSVHSTQILSLTGLGELSTTPQCVANASGLGELIVGEIVDPRTITVKFVSGEEDADMAQRFFKSGKDLVLTIKNRKIKCRCAHRALEHERGLFNKPYITLNLYCPDPYFYSVDEFGKNLAGIMPSFGFPYRASKTKGLNFGYKIFSGGTKFLNNGDKPVGIKAVFKCKASATNPQFTNLTTNKFVRLNNLCLVENDVLIISTVSGQKYITLNGNNVYSHMDRLSEFFYLDVGNNNLEFSADTGVTNLDVVLYYAPAYSNGEVDL